VRVYQHQRKSSQYFRRRRQIRLQPVQACTVLHLTAATQSAVTSPVSPQPTFSSGPLGEPAVRRIIGGLLLGDVEEHGIPAADYPAAFALWIAEITGGPVPGFEKVEQDEPETAALREPCAWRPGWHALHQRAKNLQHVDGLVGEDTWRALGVKERVIGGPQTHPDELHNGGQVVVVAGANKPGRSITPMTLKTWGVVSNADS
jgi:hypothetical protein